MVVKTLQKFYEQTQANNPEDFKPWSVVFCIGLCHVLFRMGHSDESFLTIVDCLKVKNQPSF